MGKPLQTLIDALRHDVLTSDLHLVCLYLHALDTTGLAVHGYLRLSFCLPHERAMYFARYSRGNAGYDWSERRQIWFTADVLKEVCDVTLSKRFMCACVVRSSAIFSFQNLARKSRTQGSSFPKMQIALDRRRCKKVSLPSKRSAMDQGGVQGCGGGCKQGNQRDLS